MSNLEILKILLNLRILRLIKLIHILRLLQSQLDRISAPPAVSSFNFKKLEYLLINLWKVNLINNLLQNSF